MSDLQFEKLDDVMYNKIVVVPDYQRDYSWSNAEIATLIEDLRNLYENNNNGTLTHFLGSIVLIPLDESISQAAKSLVGNPKLNKYNKYNIIDGQQRISTLSVLFIAIRDYAAKHNIELESAQSVTNMLKTGRKDEENNDIPVLHFSQENTQKCFNALLYGGDTKYAKKVGAKRILAAKNLFDAELSALFDDDSNVSENLNLYLDLILYNLLLVEIDCNQDSDAFQIFESLNATGVPLTPAEQVKNLILMRSSSKDVSLSTWEKIAEATGESSLVEFLAQFLFCKENHRVSRLEIYRTFKELLKTKPVSDVLTDMLSYSDSYKQLKQPTAGLKAASALQSLNDLGQKQAYVPLMLAASRFGIESKDFQRIADAVLVFIVRHIVCSQSSNKLDNIFSEVCEAIKNEANSADAIIDLFRNRQMEDTIFKTMFQDLSFPYSTAAQRKARVLLKRIEEKEAGSNQPLKLDYSDLSVEHIIPKQPSIEQLEGWIGKEKADELRKNDPKLDDFSEQTIMNIGNLALLYVPENSSAQNKDYASKRMCYTQAVVDKDGNNRGIPKEVFILIKDLLDTYKDEFTPESVKQRAATLAEKATIAWK